MLTRSIVSACIITLILSFVLSVYLSNLMNDKLTIRPTLAFTDKVKYINGIGDVDKLNTMLSFNASINYTIGDNFGLFVDGKNLLSNNYAEYYGYDDIGLHVHGGITLKF